ncbi:Sn1-specific diacylglycerol lipase beta [Zea mays]|uniref:Sn1-specific diacylglycerol lipase beta n=1 Tax=Zea mays TaxID=4577 RepID=A0A3L6FPP0_MAIZE|nr:Sn1-specific diacylglycerol lipase beta [Zea mays]
MARRLLSRGRLIKLDRPILPAALTRLLSRGPPTPTTSEPEDKGKKAAAAAAVLVEAVATNHKKDAEVGRDGSEEDDEDTSPPWRSWRPDVAWLSKALEPALDLYKQYSWKPFASSGRVENIPASTRTFSEILSDLQRSKISIKDWSLSDLTIGLYLIYLSQASSKNSEAFKGVQISSNKMGFISIHFQVQELIYHLELARGCYKGNAAGLARYSMLRKRNVVKFVKDSSILRPGYYIGIDPRAKLVILGIRGTHTVYDLVTDLIALSDKKVSPKGFSTHFGTYEAARWYLRHELGIIRKCLEKHKDYELRLVGHSLGGASAALLAIMLRKKSKEELGFSPDIISAVGFGTPPCISKEAAESCASYVSTVVLQDDIIPRLSAASLARLRNEILKTDWVSVLEKEDLKHIVDIVTNAKLVVSSIQDVARKLGDYAKIVSPSTNSGVTKDPTNSTEMATSISRNDVFVPEDLFLPGTLYYLQRDIEDINDVEEESYTLWKGDPGENFQRILLSGNLISDHRCESIYYALREVLKTLPPPRTLDE